MKLSEFRQRLESAPDHELAFRLPNGGGRIPAWAHITEVGRTDRRFIDCGGTIRSVSACTLQSWVADDVDHRLLPGSLAAIIGKAQPLLGSDDLDVEIEFEDGLLSQFPVTAAEVVDGALEFQLTVKRTDCLAKEVCGPADAEETSNCSGGGGCC